MTDGDVVLLLRETWPDPGLVPPIHDVLRRARRLRRGRAARLALAALCALVVLARLAS